MNPMRRTLLATTLLPFADPAQAESLHPTNCVPVFTKFLKDRGMTMPRITPRQMVEAALVFYQTVPASGLDTRHGADMLLYQWGVFNWGKGENFEFDLTRQFIEPHTNSDHGMSQLQFTACFAPTKARRDIKMSNRWCESRADAAKFSSFILTSDAYKAVQNLMPLSMKLAWTEI